MKNTFFMAAAALFLSASAHAQSTVDSIEAKYTLLPMPEQLTIEQTFPAIGTYQLNNNTNGTAAAADNNVSTTGNLTITLDSANKGIVWIEGLPQGRIKAYLKQSPATYRILAQKSASGEQVPEGTLVYDSTTHIINIALGTPYNEADPAGIFANNPANTAVGADMNETTTDATNMQTDNNVTKEKTKAGNNTVKHKAKTASSKTKSKVTYYTGTKVMMNNMNSDLNNNGNMDSNGNGNMNGNMNNTNNNGGQQPSSTTPAQQSKTPQTQPQGNPQQQ